ncbi:type II secretion system protein GspM [Desulfovermiculus halophilus]|jgi:type II secretory pathway component PulM|uniref:type II secretion system protein GspM n=1 Tax=Desulfovermiculus halophilus TaxID=339722 RepID=UPI000483EA16|nr:type II secretion system protein GspM [Desulfovermiculus halophilus]
MSDRQKKRLLYSAAAVLLLVGLIQWGLIPAQHYRQGLKQSQEQALHRLQELRQLGAELKEAQKRSEGPQERGQKQEDFTLFSFLENQATKDNIKGSVEYMRPLTDERNDRSQEKVQMRLEPVRLARLATFLAHVEQAPEGIFIERMTIRSPRQEPGRLRVDLVFATFVS